MAGPASDFHRGEMDISEQRRTFHTVMIATKWSSLALAAGLVWLVTWFCTPGGMGAGFVAAVVILAVGIAVLRERNSAAH